MCVLSLCGPILLSDIVTRKAEIGLWLCAFLIDIFMNFSQYYNVYVGDMYSSV